MDRNLLQRGDVIRLEKGMKVYATIPEMFIYDNRRTSTNNARTDIKIGEMRSSQFKTSEDVKGTLGLFNIEIEDDQISHFIAGLGINLSFDTSIFEGEYRVVATAEDGGGTGMGPHDVYPNGHHVFCEKKDDPNIFVDFYQTGCFTAMIEPEKIEPVNR